MALTVMLAPGAWPGGGSAGAPPPSRPSRVGLERGDPDPVDRADVDDPGRLLLGAGRLQQGTRNLVRWKTPFTFRDSTRSKAASSKSARGAPQVAPALLTRMSSASTRDRHLVGQAAALGLGGQVGRDADTRALCGQLGGHLSDDIRLARRDVDRRTGLHEALGDHLADAPCPPGDQCRLAGDVEEVRWSSAPLCPPWSRRGQCRRRCARRTLAPTRRDSSSTRKVGLWCIPLEPSAAPPPTKK